MQLTAGTRLRCTGCSTEVVVIRAPAQDVSVMCGEHALTFVDESVPAVVDAPPSPNEAGTQLGKRYADDNIGLELLCTKPGTGRLACDGTDLEIRAAKPLPASD
jgi:hypothetical protein